MAVTLSVNIIQNSQSITNCSSNITVNVVCRWTGGSYNKNEDGYGNPTATGWLKIDGVQYNFASTFNDNRTSSGSKTIYTKTLDIAHDSEGEKTVSCSAYYRTGTTSSGDVSASSTLKLTPIPRYARIEFAPDFNDEQNPTITYFNPAGSEVSSLQACIALESGSIVASYRNITTNGTSYTFSLTTTERNSLRSATPNSNTLTVLFRVRSILGGVPQVSELSSTMSIVNANPSLSPTIVDTNSATTALTGSSSILVAGHSTARITINAVAQKASSIVSRRVEHDNLVLTADGTLSKISTNPIRISATDSRGNTTTKIATNTVVPYFNPTCFIENTVPDVNGSMPLTVTGKFYNGSFGFKSNSLTIQYRYKESYGSYTSWKNISGVTKNGNDYTASVTVTGLDYRKAYTFQARAVDALLTSGVLSGDKSFVAEPVFDWGENDFNFNVPVYAEKVTGLSAPSSDTDAANKAYVDSKLSKSGDTMTGILNMGSNRISNLATPSATTDAANKAYVDTKISMALLWENSSPTSSFTAKTVSVNISAYTHIGIEYKLGAGSTWGNLPIKILRKGSGRIFVGEYAGNDGAGREITNMTNSGITFAAGYHNQYEDNNWMIPLKIYGVNGIA